MSTVHIYTIGGFRLASQLVLPELPPAPHGRPDIVIRCHHAGQAHEPDVWIRRWSLPDKSPWLWLARTSGGYFLRFPAYADFLVSTDAQEIVILSCQAPRRTLRHLILDQVLPLVLAERGCCILHASAVVTPSGAIAFIGPAGRGKSTLAAFFGCSGFEVMSDDCLIIKLTDGSVRIAPYYKGLRLWPDVLPGLPGIPDSLERVSDYSRKRRLNASGPVSIDSRDRTVPLYRIYSLDGPAPEVRFASLSARCSLIELVKHNYVLDPDKQEALASQFRHLSAAACSARHHRLSYPHELSRLPEVRDAILRHAAEIANFRKDSRRLLLAPQHN